MLINLRGTHGSGKTYVSHKLILNHDHTALVEPKTVQGKSFSKPNVHVVEDGLYVVGRWKSGMDGIFPQTIVEEIISYWAPQRHVLWENVMVSANVGRWCALSKELDPINHNVWAFFDTPLELCIERVFKRREESAERGFSHRQDDSEVKLDVLAGHWRRCRRCAVRAFREGIDVRWVDHRRAYELVYNTLVAESGWRPASATSDRIFSITGSEDLLRPWNPTHEEQEYVLKTSILPWEPDDTKTKVTFVSPARKKVRSEFEGLGTQVRRWGAPEGEDEPVVTESSVFGHEVKSWSTLVSGTENNPGGLSG